MTNARTLGLDRRGSWPATGAALVLAFVLGFSSPGGGFYERHFVWLFWVNVAVARCWRW
jgi:hypothetical protein